MADITAGTVNVPGVGKTKKTYVLAGVAVVGVLAVMYYRSHHAGTASASVVPSGTTDSFPSDGSVGDPTNPYSVDPSTGMTYGNEALQGGYSAFGTGNTAAGGGSGNTVTNVGPGTFTTNADWSQYAIGYLVGTSGMDSATVTNALGLYLTGSAVTPSQEQIINDAIAVAGTPPVSGANNRPPGINVSGNKAGGKTYADNPVTGLKASARYTQTDISWHPSNHASGYRVDLKDGGSVISSDHVNTTSFTFHNLKEKHKYTATVLATPARPSITSGAPVNFTTK